MPQNGALVQKSPPLTTTLALHDVVVFSDKLFTIGGTTSATALAAGGIATINVARIFGDGTLSAFTAGGNIPAARLLSDSDCTDDGLLYTIGGQNTAGAAQNTVYLTELSPEGSSIVSSVALTAFPKATMTGHKVVVNNDFDYIYVIGGGAATQTDVFYAKINNDGTLGTWNKTTAHPVDISFAGGFYFNGYLYTIGGLKNTGSVVQTACYRTKVNTDGTVGVWVKLNDMNIARHRHGLIVQNNRVYAIAGAQTTVASNAVASQEFAAINSDGTLGMWQNTGPLTQNIRNARAAVGNGAHIFTVGGFDGTNGLSSVHKVTIQHDGHL